MTRRFVFCSKPQLTRIRSFLNVSFRLSAMRRCISEKASALMRSFWLVPGLKRVALPYFNRFTAPALPPIRRLALAPCSLALRCMAATNSLVFHKPSSRAIRVTLRGEVPKWSASSWFFVWSKLATNHSRCSCVKSVNFIHAPFPQTSAPDRNSSPRPTPASRPCSPTSLSACRCTGTLTAS